jgi:hypothetical protein
VLGVSIPTFPLKEAHLNIKGRTVGRGSCRGREVQASVKSEDSGQRMMFPSGSHVPLALHCMNIEFRRSGPEAIPLRKRQGATSASDTRRSGRSPDVNTIAWEHILAELSEEQGGQALHSRVLLVL